MAVNVVVLGGYGNFGSRICEALARDGETQIFVAGRNLPKARAMAQKLGPCAEPVALDHRDPHFVEQLMQIGAAVVIHTAGPFQEQDYAVAAACIEAGCHYLDLADGRSFVTGIALLHQAASFQGVLVASGASSVPALSSAVIDHYLPQFGRLDAICHGISSGARPPGMATMRAVMGYVGKRFERMTNGQWAAAYGWQDIHVQRYPDPVGLRWLANCDVPDLELFPRRYSGVKTVTFHAGLGFASTTLAIWGLSWLVRAGLVQSLEPISTPLHKIAIGLAWWGTRWSAMHVSLIGTDLHGASLNRTWYLLAGNDQGSQIPCLPAIALARKLVRGQISQRGAMPCVGLLQLQEILDAVPELDIHISEA